MEDGDDEEVEVGEAAELFIEELGEEVEESVATRNDLAEAEGSKDES